MMSHVIVLITTRPSGKACRNVVPILHARTRETASRAPVAGHIKGIPGSHDDASVARKLLLGHEFWRGLSSSVIPSQRDRTAMLIARKGPLDGGRLGRRLIGATLSAAFNASGVLQIEGEKRQIHVVATHVTQSSRSKSHQPRQLNGA